MKIVLLFALFTPLVATDPGHYTKKPTPKQAQNMRDELAACTIAWIQMAIHNGRPMIYCPYDPMNKAIKLTTQKMAEISATLKAHGELND